MSDSETFVLDAPRRGVALREDGQSSQTREGTALLRSRLVSFVLLVLFGLGLFLIRELIIGGSQLLTRIAVVLGLSFGLALLRSRRSLSLRQLRALELSSVALVSLQLAWQFGSRLVTETERAQLLVGRQKLASAVFALMIAYGLIVPNRAFRAAVVTLSIAVVAFAFPILAVMSREDLSLIAPQFGSIASTTGVGFYLLLGIAGAVFGSHTVTRLRADVRDARRLGQYLLEERIGQGGMGEVWRARHAFLARPAAIKLIRRKSGSGGWQESLGRFEREAQATAALSSLHTITLYDFGTTDDQAFYYAMELLDGFNLEALVRDHGPQPPERAIALIRQACRSLSEAHDKGLVHRDIKPANLFCCRLGAEHDVVKVLDFGLVAEFDATKPSAAPGEGVVGTPAFLSPEAVEGRPVGPAADLYGLGCVLYWLLCGARVFAREDPVAMAFAHASEPATAPSKALGKPLPEGLDALVLACLEKDPALRPASARDLADRLDAIALPAPWTSERAESWWRNTTGDGSAPRA